MSRQREMLPVVAGTRVSDGDGASCTVGAVLSWKPSRLLPAGNFARETRYAVTARHCFGIGDEVYVGLTHVGHVSALSPDADLELVQIDPVLDPAAALSCAAHGSQAAFCNPYAYRARASSRVIARGLDGVERPLPLSGSTTAPATGDFCTSGAPTGVRCRWRSFEAGQEPVPNNPEPHQVAAHSPVADAVRDGDSGGPVFTYDHRLIGIIARKMYLGSILFYVPASQLSSDFPYYEMAPTT